MPGFPQELRWDKPCQIPLNGDSYYYYGAGGALESLKAGPSPPSWWGCIRNLGQLLPRPTEATFSYPASTGRMHSPGPMGMWAPGAGTGRGGCVPTGHLDKGRLCSGRSRGPLGPCGGHLQPPSSLMVRGSPVPHAQHRSSKKPKTPGVHGPNRYHPLLILVGLDVLLGESPTQQTRHAHTPSATNQGAVLAPQTKPPHRLDERSHRQPPLPWGPGQHPLAPRKGAGRKRNRQSEWAGAAALHWKPGHRQPAPGPLQHREGSAPANPWPPAPRDAGEGRHQGLQLVQSTRSGVSDCRAAGGDSRGPLLAWPPCPARSTDQLTGACYLHQESQQDEAGSLWTNKHVKIAKCEGRQPGRCTPTTCRHTGRPPKGSAEPPPPGPPCPSSWAQTKANTYWCWLCHQ